MDIIIRDVGAADIDAVLGLNQSEVPHVGSVDLEQMRWFAANAQYFRVAVSTAGLAAFLVGFRPGSSYQSPNYRWFCRHYEEFAYVDRVAVAKPARRAGIAAQMYDDFAATMPNSVGIMTCEVNIRPPNASSMTFHERLGFKQVGSLTSEEGEKTVAMLARDL